MQNVLCESPEKFGLKKKTPKQNTLPNIVVPQPLNYSTTASVYTQRPVVSIQPKELTKKDLIKSFVESKNFTQHNLNIVKSDSVYLCLDKYLPVIKTDMKSINTPVVINVKNKSDKTLPVSVFGAIKNLNAVNFGQHKDIEITSCSPHISYAQILSSTNLIPNHIACMRFIDQKNPEQLKNTVTLSSWNTIGQKFQTQICKSNAFSPFSHTTSILDVIHSFRLDGFTSVDFDMLPDNDLTIYFYHDVQIILNVIFELIEEEYEHCISVLPEDLKSQLTYVFPQEAATYL